MQRLSFIIHDGEIRQKRENFIPKCAGAHQENQKVRELRMDFVDYRGAIYISKCIASMNVNVIETKVKKSISFVGLASVISAHSKSQRV